MTQPVLITGGAGFVGINLAHRLLGASRKVLLLDNLSRPGVEKNLAWLCAVHGKKVLVKVADIRDRGALDEAVRQAGQVYHLAAQVAVTTSLDDPIRDFETNARGTLNLLEALRRLQDPPPLIFTSTNKVYGALTGLTLHRNGSRYVPGDSHRGISEETPLDFHSPYGCSKGTADQYVLDYARSFGLRAVVLRMSCIYGPHQCGTEDQGWVAHFLISTLAKRPITLYGDGMQVRDVLFIDDLIDAFLLTEKNIDALSGQAFNMGGGPENATSLLELIDLIAELHGKKPMLRFDQWRPGDQRYFVSDTRKFQEATLWRPKVSIREGLERLYAWLLTNAPTAQLAGQGR